MITNCSSILLQLQGWTSEIFTLRFGFPSELLLGQFWAKNYVKLSGESLLIFFHPNFFPSLAAGKHKSILFS